MSYFADHLAWQQRVAQEFKAQSNSNLENQYFQAGGHLFNYPDLVNYLKQSQKRGGTSSQRQRQQSSQSNYFRANDNRTVDTFIQQVAPGSVPAYNGIIKTQDPKKSQFGDMAGYENSVYSYAPKSKMIYQKQSAQGRRARTGAKYPMQRQSNQLRIQSSKGHMDKAVHEIGPYVFEQDYNIEERSQADNQSRLNKTTIQRFNEDLGKTFANTKSQGTRSQYSLKVPSLVQSQSKRPYKQGEASQLKSNIGSKSVFSNYNQQQKKFNIYQAVEKLDDLQIDQISAIISDDRHNQEQAKAAEENEKQDHEQNIDDNAVEVQIEDERDDQVHELGQKNDENDKLTSISEQKQPLSQISQLSGKTYISQLQKQLNGERWARQNLEKELDQLKKISSEISSQLSQMQKQEQMKNHMNQGLR